MHVALVPVMELSTVETLALVALVAAAAYLYYHGPQMPAAGLGTPLTGPLDGTYPAPRDCGPGCVVCPGCGVENAATYAYCRGCARMLKRHLLP